MKNFIINNNDLNNLINSSIKNYYIALSENVYEDKLLTLLNETRGIIDNLEPIIKIICEYINNIIESGSIKNYFISTNNNFKYNEYYFSIPTDIFDKIDLDFMISPKFNIFLFQSFTDYSDLDFDIKDSYYEAHSEPNIKVVNNKVYMFEPIFQISLNTNSKFVFPETQLSKKLRHEITHCKGNLFEYLHNKEQLRNKMSDSILINGLSDSNEINRILKRIHYLINQDEINARAHQIYSELDNTLNNTFLRTLKNRILHCNIYEITINEFNEYIKLLQYNSDNKLFSEQIRNIFNIKKKNPSIVLLNKLIFAKNKQILQFQKVAEKWLYDLEKK